MSVCQRPFDDMASHSVFPKQSTPDQPGRKTQDIRDGGPGPVQCADLYGDGIGVPGKRYWEPGMVPGSLQHAPDATSTNSICRSTLQTVPSRYIPIR